MGVAQDKGPLIVSVDFFRTEDTPTPPSSLTPSIIAHSLAQELEARYVAVKDDKEAERLWSSLYELTSRERGKGRPSVRVKRMHVATGAVLRCWGAVRAAVKQAKLKSGRRIRVVRVESTDEPPVRLVGMVIPEEVVEDVKRRMGVAEQSKGADGDGTIVVSD